jgi:hypothetical protein
MSHRRVVGDVNILLGDSFNGRGPFPRRSGRSSRCIEEQNEEEEDVQGQDDASSSKKKKGWVAIPYVPTVNFQTPMPQRSSKPRGGARGGRKAGLSRGTHNNATSPTVTSPTTNKAQGFTPRERGEDQGRGRGNHNGSVGGHSPQPCHTNG